MMIEISESKVEKMSDYAEKMLRYGGKLMQCIEELSEGESMGERWDDDDRYYDDEVWVSAVVTVDQVVVWDKDGAFVEPDVIPVIVKCS